MMTEEQNNRQQPQQPSQAAPRYARTAGEVIHNELTYRGVDWVANTAFAVGFAFLANRTAFGRRNYSDRMQSGFKILLSPFIKDSERLAQTAELGTDFTSIMVGGTVIIPPMMLLHHNRRPIVEWLDSKIYDAEEIQHNPRFAVRYEALDQQPEKSFGTGMAARILVLAPMITAHMNTNTNPSMQKWLYKPVEKASKWVAKETGIKPNAWMQQTITNKEGKAVSHWDYLHNIIGMDLSLTAIYSFAHEWTYKGLSHLFAPEPAQAPSTQLADQPRVALGALMQPPAQQQQERAHG
jgi:hypothetical protein